MSDVFSDRREEGRRNTPMNGPSYATPGARAAESYLKHGVSEESKLQRSATLAAATKARVKARRSA